MKKIFLLLVAACLLCCVSCKKNQPAPEPKNKEVTAYEAAMAIYDKIEKDLKQSKSCEDLEKIRDYAEKEFGKWEEKYEKNDDEKGLSKEEEEKCRVRDESIDNLYSRKQQEFGCGGGYDDSYNNYTGTAAFVAAMRIFDKVEQYIYQSNTCEDLEELESKFDYEIEEWENTYDEDTDMSANEREQLKNRSNQLGNIIISKAKQLGCDGGYGNSGYDDYDDYDDYDY